MRKETERRAMRREARERGDRSPHARDNTEAREGGQSLPLLLSHLFTIWEELLQVREKGLERRNREPTSELLEHEGEARGGEAELLGSIEEASTKVGRESH